MNLSDVSGAFRKDEIQHPEQKGCPLSIVTILAGAGAGFGTILVATWLAVERVIGL